MFFIQLLEVDDLCCSDSTESMKGEEYTSDLTYIYFHFQLNKKDTHNNFWIVHWIVMS